MPNAVIFARALHALHTEGVLNNPACKHVIKMFIRQSSEDRLWNLSTNYRSRAAAEIIKAANLPTSRSYHDFCYSKQNGLAHEHMVPGAVVYQLLVNHRNPSIAAFLEILRCTGYRATITAAENRRLLRSTMPPSYFDPNSDMYLNHRARYIAAGIYDDLEPLPDEQGWWMPRI